MAKKVKLSNSMEPSARAFLEPLNAATGPQIYELTVQDARAVLTNAQAGAIDKLPADIEDRTVPGGPTGEVSIRIVRPQGNTALLPVLMYFHGGGWVLGDKNTHDRLVREIANRAHAAVVFVNYTPSPEAKYPVPVEEGYAATKYVAENGRNLGLDPARLAVGGDSAGGCIAAAVTLLAKQRSGPRIGYQVLFYPVTDANFETGSYRKFATGHFLTKEAMKWFWNHYLPGMDAAQEITASPLRASLDQLRGLPPAVLITGEYDVLRDEGEAYAGKLTEAGVPVIAVRYLGIIHDFVMLHALAGSPQARSAIALASANLQAFFKGHEALGAGSSAP